MGMQGCTQAADGKTIPFVPSSHSHSQIALNTPQASISPIQRLNYMLLLYQH